MNALPKSWVEADFCDLFDFKGGSQPPKSEFINSPRDGYIRLLQIRDFESDDKAVYIKNLDKWPKCAEDDIMIGRYGASVGKILSGKSGAYNVALVRLIYDRKFLDRKWVSNYLNSDHFQAPLKQISRSAQNGFNKEDLQGFLIPLPPANEQKRIAEKLDNLFTRSRAAREELTAVPRLIERYKQAILSAAFSGELTRDWRGKSNQGLPSSWKTLELQKIADIQSGLALGKKRKADSVLKEIAYLRVANVQRGFLKLNEVKTLMATSQEIDRLLLQKGDILMNEGGDRDKLGRGWVWEGQVSPCIHQNHVFRIRLFDKDFPPKFISYFANEFGQTYFFDEGTQTTNLASISKSKVSALPIPVPPRDEAWEIVRRIEKAFAVIDAIAAKTTAGLRQLSHLEAQCLNKAFLGELVPQDPSDEPASALLDRLHTESVPATAKRSGRKAKG